MLMLSQSKNDKCVEQQREKKVGKITRKFLHAWRREREQRIVAGFLGWGNQGGVSSPSYEQRVQLRSPFSQHFIVYKPPVE